MNSRILLLLLTLLALGCKSPGYHVGSSAVTYVTRDLAGHTQSHQVKGADPASFSVIQEPFAKDKSKVFYHGVELAGADPATFRLLDADFYSTDGKLVFAGRNLISHDAENFVILEKGYSRDSQEVFYLGKKVPGARADGFELLEGPGAYARDGVGAYREGKTIVGAEGATFEPLNYYYSRDEKQVFHQEDALEGADPKTFHTEPKRQLARDGNKAWYLDFELDLNGPKTQFLDGLYLKDEKSVFYGNLRIEEADPASFETYTENGAIFGKDKNGIYSAGRRRD